MTADKAGKMLEKKEKWKGRKERRMRKEGNWSMEDGIKVSFSKDDSFEI
jgi:hypothetical protein